MQGPSATTLGGKKGGFMAYLEKAREGERKDSDHHVSDITFIIDIPQG